jgi:peptide/nickel transport system ATP-binding protein
MTMAPLLEIRDLTVDFRSPRGLLRALDKVSLSVREGEVLGVVGESGAGKSLTGLAVAGLLPAGAEVTAGSLTIAGATVDRPTASSMRRFRGRTIGMVFQNPMTSLDPLFKVGDQLAETLDVHGAPRAGAAALLEQVGLDPGRILEMYPHELSGGMRQRVVIALAIAAAPRLIIADEPTTALDTTTQAHIVDLLMRLCADSGMAMMLVTHDIGLLARAAGQTVVMYAGRVVEAGPTRALIDRPLHPYTRGLINSVPPLSRRVGRLRQLDGVMPRLGPPLAGCAFAPRCTDAIAACNGVTPALREGGRRAVACWAYDPAAGSA